MAKNDIIKKGAGSATCTKATFKSKGNEKIEQIISTNMQYRKSAAGRCYRPMHPDWVRELRDQCKVARLPFFFKQWGEWTEHRLSEAKQLKSVFHKGFGQDMCRVGKKSAGRLLDGVLHNEFPKTT